MPGAGHTEGIELVGIPAGTEYLDYVGLNYYRRETVSARSDQPFDWTADVPAGAEVTDMNWHVAPDGLTAMLLELQRRYSPKDIVISENGAAYDDKVEADGSVRDADRQSYLARHLAAVADARDAGVPSRATTSGRSWTTTSGASATRSASG